MASIDYSSGISSLLPQSEQQKLIAMLSNQMQASAIIGGTSPYANANTLSGNSVASGGSWVTTTTTAATTWINGIEYPPISAAYPPLYAMGGAYAGISTTTKGIGKVTAEPMARPVSASEHLRNVDGLLAALKTF